MLNIFLDLDETLVRSFKKNKLGVNYVKPGIYEKGTIPPHAENKKQLALLISQYIWSVTDDYVVCHRPYLEVFLNAVMDRYNVGVWTAASARYAIQIIKNLKFKKLGLFLYDKHWPKDLKKLNNLGYSMYNTYIIDDLEEVEELQPNNCLRIKPFKAGIDQTDDYELLKILTKLINLEYTSKK
ncbi:Catalytic domain of ctd-like phosphatases [lymphocystis disease virus-China]|uniref:Catalytic domain of ctd-like phosphatases n=2 Tax=Lymphocystis disease virus 2 TaxID=159183 RepID=A0A6F8X077_9VIRU|nr:Catalytic domain of ctd-like phosphatases [lymphocystis disease virus-China]AAU10992.1 Catalytic domain of ctd-like phosphatases [lymphocystis disease virus-China]BCB67498.1 catalytic domain of ctd-like phosphatases [Lymphocystis disease virus 2]